MHVRGWLAALCAQRLHSQGHAPQSLPSGCGVVGVVLLVLPLHAAVFSAVGLAPLSQPWAAPCLTPPQCCSCHAYPNTAPTSKDTAGSTTISPSTMDNTLGAFMSHLPKTQRGCRALSPAASRSPSLCAVCSLLASARHTRLVTYYRQCSTCDQAQSSGVAAPPPRSSAPLPHSNADCSRS